MRIALLTTEYPTDPTLAGGLASYLRRLAETLCSEGHQAEVFLAADRNETTVVGGVTLHYVKVEPKWTSRMTTWRGLWRFPGLAPIVDRTSALTNAVRLASRRSPIEIVQAPDYLAPAIMTVLSTEFPVITRVSSYGPYWQAAYQAPFDRAVNQAHLAETVQRCLSCAVYTPSLYLARAISEREQLKITVMRPPFQPSQLSWARDKEPPFGLARDSYVLFFGSVGRLKGVDRLADILPNVLAACSDMKFVFAGKVLQDRNGASFDTVVESRLEGLANRVTFVGALGHETLMPLVAGARYVVMPSRYDNLPNACLEAMALRRPVIATRDASFEELIEPGVNGELVTQDNNEALATAMIHYWRLAQDRRSAMGEASERALERFAPSRVIPPLIELYKQTSARHARGKCRHSRWRRAQALRQLFASGTSDHAADPSPAQR